MIERTEEQERQDFINANLSFEGVKYGHLKRLNDPKIELTDEIKKRCYLDCAGLLICSAKKADLFQEELDMGIYSHVPDGFLLTKHMNTFFKKKDFKDVKPGDILVMRFNNLPTHFAVYLGYMRNNEQELIIHAYTQSKKVVVQSLSEEWKNYVCGVYVFKNWS